jgi:hypothetical protein
MANPVSGDENVVVNIRLIAYVKDAIKNLREAITGIDSLSQKTQALGDWTVAASKKWGFSWQEILKSIQAVNQELLQTKKASLTGAFPRGTDIFGFTKEYITSLPNLEKAQSGATRAAQEHTSGLSFLGTTAAFVFGSVFGVTVIGALKKVINTTKEAMQAGVDYLKVMYRMEVAAFALQRAGKQIDFRDLVIQAEALQKAFPTFSKQQAMASVSYIALLTREFGFAEQQIKDVIKVSAVMAVIMGKDINEAAREVALTLSSGYSESLQRAGLNINRVVIQQEALRMGYKEGYQYLTGEVKAQAALNVVMRQLDPLYDKALEYYKTIPGEIDTARAAWQNYMTVLGASLAPAKSAWAQFWTDMLNIAIEGTQKMQIYQLMPLFDIMMEKTKYGFAKSIEEMEQDLENFRKTVKQLFPAGIPEGDFSKWVVETYGQEFLDKINAAANATDEFADVVYTRLSEAAIAANKFGASLYLSMEQIEELKKKLAATDLVLIIDTEQGKKDLADFDIKVAEDKKALVDTLTGIGIDVDTGQGKKEIDDFTAYWDEQRRIFLLKTVLTLDTDEAKQRVAEYESYVKSLFPDGITAEAKLRLLFQGLTPSDMAKIEGMVGTVKVPVRVIPTIDVSGLTSTMKGFMQQVAGLTGGGGGGGGDRAGDFRRQQQRALEDYNRSVLEEGQKFNERLEKENTRYRNNEIEAEQRHQEKMLQLRERFLFDLEDALHERDARQVLRLIRQYKLEKTQAEREYEERKAERARQFEETKAMIREEHEERLRLMQEEFELRRQREEEDYKKRSAAGAGQSKKDLEALNKAWDDEVKALAAAEAKKLGLSTEGAFELEKLYLEYYGSDGLYAKELEASVVEQLIWLDLWAKALERIIALQGSLPIGGGGGGGGGGKRAKGGLDLVTRPTTFRAGEGNVPELAMFIPLDKLMGGMPSFDGGVPSSIGGKIEVAVRLSDGLEAEIISQSLHEVAAVIKRTQRSK